MMKEQKAVIFHLKNRVCVLDMLYFTWKIKDFDFWLAEFLYFLSKIDIFRCAAPD